MSKPSMSFMQPARPRGRRPAPVVPAPMAEVIEAAAASVEALEAGERLVLSRLDRDSLERCVVALLRQGRLPAAAGVPVAPDAAALPVAAPEPSTGRQLAAAVTQAYAGPLGAVPLLATEEMARRLGMSGAAVRQAIRERRFLGFEPAGRGWMVPAFFADARLERRALEKVVRALDALPAAMKLEFLTQPRGALQGDSPLGALARGELDAVLALAQAFAHDA